MKILKINNCYDIIQMNKLSFKITERYYIHMKKKPNIHCY